MGHSDQVLAPEEFYTICPSCLMHRSACQVHGSCIKIEEQSFQQCETVIPHLNSRYPLFRVQAMPSSAHQSPQSLGAPRKMILHLSTARTCPITAIRFLFPCGSIPGCMCRRYSKHAKPWRACTRFLGSMTFTLLGGCVFYSQDL